MLYVHEIFGRVELSIRNIQLDFGTDQLFHFISTEI